MTTPYVAPYGGLLTKTLDDEKEREEKLKEQQINVTVNDNLETLRPESIFIKGVDNLSTDDLKFFIDYYLNFETITKHDDEGNELLEYVAKPINDQLTFKIQWINDTSINVVFKTHEEAFKALSAISISSNPNENQTISPPSELTSEYIADIIQERETKPYNPTIQFRKKQNLLNRLNSSEEKPENVEDELKMDEDESAIVLYTRQSLQNDRKVKNASAYSRYYLLHGEPERKPKRFNDRQRQQRGNRRRQSNDEDLFANKIGGNRRARDDEEDLFADKLRNRDRSPGREQTRARSRSPMRDY